MLATTWTKTKKQYAILGTRLDERTLNALFLLGLIRPGVEQDDAKILAYLLNCDSYMVESQMENDTLDVLDVVECSDDQERAELRARIISKAV
jgi:hypothetical protein